MFLPLAQLYNHSEVLTLSIVSLQSHLREWLTGSQTLLSKLHSETLQENCLFVATAVKTQPTMIPQWFILMAKLLIYQIKFQSAGSCAKTGPRKENRFSLRQNFFQIEDPTLTQRP